MHYRPLLLWSESKKQSTTYARTHPAFSFDFNGSWIRVVALLPSGPLSIILFYVISDI